MTTNSIALELGRRLSPEMLETCRALGDIAEPGTLFIVGGAVRDILLGNDPTEVDLVVQGNAEALAQRAVEARIARRTAVSQFMTVKLTIGAREMDIATARTESYYAPGALPDVTPATIETDLTRRDFAANAIAAAIGPADFGRLTDPLRGVIDVQTGVLRALHSASFRDDATRMIRAARYTSRLQFRLHHETEAWLKGDAAHIRTVGPDRLRKEFNRLWRDKRPAQGLHLLHSWGVLDHIPTASAWPGGLSGISLSDRAPQTTPDNSDVSDIYWALIATTVGKEFASLIEALNLEGSARRAVEDIRHWAAGGSAEFREAVQSGRPSNIVDTLTRYDTPALQALSLNGDSAQSQAITSYLNTWKNVQPELNGDDLLAMGVRQGPLVGKFLDQLRKDRLDGLVVNRDGEAQSVRRWTGHGSGASGVS